jgi:preprotein translocase subunit SecG
MLIFVTIIHVLLCVFMIFVILLQPGKDAGMGAAFGGGAATSAFGGRGAVTFLSKVTAVCAGLFFLTSLGLSFVGMSGSVAARVPPPASAPAATPEAADTQSQSAPGATDAPAPLEPSTEQPAQRTDDSAGGTAPAAGTDAPTPAQPAPDTAPR